MWCEDWLWLWVWVSFRIWIWMLCIWLWRVTRETLFLYHMHTVSYPVWSNDDTFNVCLLSVCIYINWFWCLHSYASARRSRAELYRSSTLRLIRYIFKDDTLPRCLEGASVFIPSHSMSSSRQLDDDDALYCYESVTSEWFEKGNRIVVFCFIAWIYVTRYNNDYTTFKFILRKNIVFPLTSLRQFESSSSIHNIHTYHQSVIL